MTFKGGRTMASMVLLALLASSQISSVAGSTTVTKDGMQAHPLESPKDSSVLAPTAKAGGAAVLLNQNAGVLASSALAADGSGNGALVSEAVSLAGTIGLTYPIWQPAPSTSPIRVALTSSSTLPPCSQPTVSSSTSTPASVASSTTTPAPSPVTATQMWHYFAGAMGCAGGSASGSQFICHQTAVDVTYNRRRSAKEYDAMTPAQRDQALDEEFDDIWSKRQSSGSGSSDQTNNDPSGNGGPPVDILNKDSPDIGWLDLIVGAVPYRNGDLAPSIVWILATLLLFPLFLIRLLRRSSLVAHVLFTVFLWGSSMLVIFAIRAYQANDTPTTTMINVMNIMLQILPCLLIEPLLNLLALYAQQGGFPTGVPRVALFLRLLNLIALILYVVGAGYLAHWLSQWNGDLMTSDLVAEKAYFPTTMPPSISRIGPIAAAFMQVVCILGAFILIPIARGENGSMRPGGFLALLVVLITIPIVYRVLQTLHAQSELTSEAGGGVNPFQVLAAVGNSVSSAAANALQDLVPVSSVAPPGMYSSDVSGIDWKQLQQTLAGRGRIQSPLVFNLVYIFPQWMMTFLFFFVHAPGHENAGKLAPASAQP